MTLVERGGNFDDPAFRAWFGNSKVVDASGQPLVVYHGTSKNFDTFKLPGRAGSGGNAIFFATEPSTANYFTHGAKNARVIPAYIRMENPFDFRNPQHVTALKAFVAKNFRQLFPGALFGPNFVLDEIDDGDYGVLEKPLVRRWMRRRGFDGFWTRENRWSPVTLGVFDPSQIKSAIHRASA